jgi:bla regulator protein blaR1
MVPNELTVPLVNHLWQSTVVVAVAWVLTLALKKNHARVRYWVWIVASMKFLVPFSLLMAAGEWIRSLMPSGTMAQPVIAIAMEQVAQPFATGQVFGAAPATVEAQHADWLPWVLLAVWACGVMVVVGRFARGWWRVYAAKRAATETSNCRSFTSSACGKLAQDDSGFFVARSVPVLVSAELMEPGIFGIFRPVLLLPEGILERLTAEQMRAVIAHEMEHVRRRDNLTYALHMVVEALFWFYPPVWWIGARLIDERERACDEAVVEAGGQAEAYAEGILNVCKFCMESPVGCVAGVTGADLKRRIARIMTGIPVTKLSFGRKLLVVTMGAVAISAPLAAGLVDAARISAQLLQASGPRPSFEVATVKPSQSSAEVYDLRLSQERLTAEAIPLDRLIRFAYNVKSDNQMENVPSWAGAEKFDINAKMADAQFEKMKSLPPEQRFEQYQLMLQSLLADRFKLTVSTQVKELPVYALVAVKGGSKLTPAEVSTDPRDLHYGELVTNKARGELKATGVSAARLAQWLSGTPEAGNRAVIDTTGLTGRYNFTLQWTPVEMSNSSATASSAEQGPAGASSAEPSGPGLFSALQEDLGLKLVPQKAPVQVLVIDHIEQPTPN